MGQAKHKPGDKHAEALRFIEAVVSDVHKEMGGGFRSTCLGIELGIKVASEKIEREIVGLRIEFSGEALSVTSVELGDADDVKVEGLWAAIYALACPRYTPFGGDPLKIKSITISHKKNPIIEYDANHECGIPLALDRDYIPETLVKK